MRLPLLTGAVLFLGVLFVADAPERISRFFDALQVDGPAAVAQTSVRVVTSRVVVPPREDVVDPEPAPEDEAVDETHERANTNPPVRGETFQYLLVKGGCGADFSGGCVNVRSAPGTSSPVVAQIRDGAVLRMGSVRNVDGMTWYEAVFDEWVRYPERAAGSWFISGEYVEVIASEGPVELPQKTEVSSAKRIVIDRSEQTLYAYDGDELFLEVVISTGTDLNPTPRGAFSVYRKTPTRYMQGPLPGITSQYYDLPGVPWNLYFTEEGGAIHGAYWHESFGTQWSHGCVNVPLEDARKLYEWADLGTEVSVRD